MNQVQCEKRPEIRDALCPGMALGCVAQVLVRSNSSPGTYLTGRANPFHLNHAPPISLPEFTARLYKYFACSREAFVVAVAYLRRLHAAAPEIFGMQSAHKLILTTLTVAAKFTDDVACKQKHYAQCGGVDAAELSTLEATLLHRLNFTVFVTASEYDECCALLLHLDSHPLSSTADVANAFADIDVHAYKQPRAAIKAEIPILARGSC